MTERITAGNPELDIFSSFLYEGVSINPRELVQRYISTPHGIHHSQQQLRFAQPEGYKYEPREQFLKDLGDDVHPVRHMLHTHDNITVPLIAYQNSSQETRNFTETEIAELRTTAALHDLGECTHQDMETKLGFKPKGDLKYGTGLPADKLNEKLIRNHLYDLYYPDLPRKLLDRVDEIDFKESDDFCVLAFDMIERLGYYTTSRMAARVVIQEKANYKPGDNRIAQLGRLATIVSNTHYSVLRSHEETFPYLKGTLDKLIQPVVV